MTSKDDKEAGQWDTLIGVIIISLVIGYATQRLWGWLFFGVCCLVSGIIAQLTRK